MLINENETQMLLRLLSYELFAIPLQADASTVNWDKVLDEANRHVVTALLYPGIKRIEGVPEYIVTEVRNAAITSSIQSERMLAAQQEIISLLESQGIPSAVLKGTSVAYCYPHPELRLPGDIDLLVGGSNYEKAYHVLEGAGFSLLKAKELHAELRKEDIHVEVHQMTSVFPASPKGVYAENYMDNALDALQIQTLHPFSFPTLSETHQLISLLAHMERHIRQLGIGLRQLCDWAVTIQHLRSRIGQEELQILERSGLLHFAKIITKICEECLGLPQCDWSEDAPDLLVNKVTKDILTAGNFQTQYKERSIGRMMMSRSGNADSPAKTAFLTNYFASVKRKAEYDYPWAKNPLWVLFFSIYYPIRWAFRVLRGKRKKINPVNAIKMAKSREQMLNDLNLYQ